MRPWAKALIIQYSSHSPDSCRKGVIQVPHKAVKWQQGSNPVLFLGKHGANIHVILHKCQGMDVSNNHLLSGNLGIWALLTTRASNTASLRSHKPSSYCTGFLSPLLRAVSLLLTPPAHSCPRTAIISSFSTNSLRLFSAPATDKCPCTNMHTDLARPWHQPPS